MLQISDSRFTGRLSTGRGMLAHKLAAPLCPRRWRRTKLRTAEGASVRAALRHHSQYGQEYLALETRVPTAVRRFPDETWLLANPAAISPRSLRSSEPKRPFPPLLSIFSN